MSRNTRAVIDLNAIAHNFQQVKKRVGQVRIMAVVKADAYGHGLAQVGQMLHHADALAVACLKEACELREAGISTRIVLLEGIHKAQDMARVRDLNLDLVVHHLSQVAMLEQANSGSAVNVWLKFDTGMRRLGFPMEDVPHIYQRLKRCHVVADTMQLMSHLSCADEVDNPFSQTQNQRFIQAVQGLEGPRSLANSAGILAWPECTHDWVRPGLMLYGISPLPNQSGEELGLKPAMQLESELISTATAAHGQPVGYGATFTCPEQMPVGVVAIGYGDGYPRHTHPLAPVLIKGKRCPVIGNVSMDMLTVDLRPCPDAKIGDKVELWGQNIAVPEVAKYANTIPWVLPLGLTDRVDVQYHGGAKIPTGIADYGEN